MTDMTKISAIVLGLIAIVGFFGFQAVGLYNNTGASQINRTYLEFIGTDLDVIKADLNDTLTNLDGALTDLDDVLADLDDILMNLDTLADPDTATLHSSQGENGT